MRPPSPRTVDLLIGFGVLLGTLTLLLLLSRVTAVSADEQPSITAARAVGGWFDRVAMTGTSALSSKERDLALATVHSNAQPQTLLSGLVWRVAAHRHAWMPETLALRAGSLLLHAFGVAMLFFVAAGAWGRRTALLACALALFVPRSLQVLAGAGPDAAAMAAWMILSASYLRSLRARTVLSTLVTGAVFGLCLAISGSVLWLAGVLVLHTLWVRRAELRAAAREGSIPVPSALLSAIVLGPLVYLLLTPWLWNDTMGRVRQLVTHAIAPSIVPAFFSGAMVAAPPLPRTYALWAIMLSLPTITVVLTGAGAAVLLRRWRIERGTASAQGPSPGALALIALLFAVLWPALCPDTLAVYPPRWVIAIPLVAVMAANGLEACIRLTVELAGARKRLGAALAVGLAVLCLGVPVFESVHSPSTLHAAASPLIGGPRTLSGTFLLTDATMVASLAPAIDQQGRANAAIWAPEVGQDVWDSLRNTGRLRTVVRSAPNARDADLAIVPLGVPSDTLPRSGPAATLLGVVKRDGAILMALHKVR